MTRSGASLLRPYLVRPGAGFTCDEHGFCCSDLHLLGPLERGDLIRLRRLGVVGLPLERTPKGTLALGLANGSCSMLSEGRCSIHAAHGAAAKPMICRRFPFDLVATPLGGRITTMHRCPCRTLGERRALDPAAIEASLTNPQGKVVAGHHAPKRVPITSNTTVSYATYVERESAWIERLVAGEDAHAVLGTEATAPILEELTWRGVARTFQGTDRRSLFGAAMYAFGCALVGEVDAAPTPWREQFARARRATARRTAPLVLGDWAADLVWDLRWTRFGGLDLALTELAFRYDLAVAMTRSFVAAGVPDDQAAAEAILVAETAGESRVWQQVVLRMQPGAHFLKNA